jgi:hypothetical protein
MKQRPLRCLAHFRADMPLSATTNPEAPACVAKDGLLLIARAQRVPADPGASVHLTVSCGSWLPTTTMGNPTSMPVGSKGPGLCDTNHCKYRAPMADKRGSSS